MKTHEFVIKITIVGKIQTNKLIKKEIEEYKKKIILPNNFSIKDVFIEKLHKIGQNNGSIIIKKYPIDDLIDKIGLGKINLEGYKVNMNSKRLLVFKENPRCCCCGLEGTVFTLETHKEGQTPHINLYGLENDELILMTKDHIKPKSKGGNNTQNNFQTMCAICNGLKGDLEITLSDLALIRAEYNKHYKLPKTKLNKIMQKLKNEIVDR